MKEFFAKIRDSFTRFLSNLKRRRRIHSYRRTSPRRAAGSIKKATPLMQSTSERSDAPASPKKLKITSIGTVFHACLAGVCGFCGDSCLLWRAAFPRQKSAWDSRGIFCRHSHVLPQDEPQGDCFALGSAHHAGCNADCGFCGSEKYSAKSEEQAQAALSTAVLTAPEPEEPPKHAEPGMTNPVVTKIQSRLIELGYMGDDEPSLTYNDQIAFLL